MRRLGLRVSFITKGMSMECCDDKGNRVLRLEMSEVDVVGENYRDKSGTVTGSLGGLHIIDTFAQCSLYDRILTVSKQTDKMVRVEMSTFDFFSISYPGYDKNISVTISRPEITLLIRIFGQLRRYAALFGLPKEEQTVSSVAKDSLTEGGPQAVARGPTRVHIALEHPVLILPCSSLSQEKIVADLGMIQVENVQVPASSDLDAPTVQWLIKFKQMKLETVSANGHSSVVAENVDGVSKIMPTVREAGNRSTPSLSVEVQLQNVTGCLTEAQYALLLGVFGQNMTERYINPHTSSAVNAEAIETPEDVDIAKEISFQQLSEQVQEALSRLLVKLVTMQITIKIAQLNVAILFSGAQGLDAAPSSLIPLVQAVGKRFVAQFSIFDRTLPEDASPESEDLRWQLQATCATLQVLNLHFVAFVQPYNTHTIALSMACKITAARTVMCV